MKSFKNMKIGRKLTVGFMIIAIISAIIGTVGIVGMMQINNADTKLYEEQTKPLEDMFSLVKSLYQMRIELRTAVISYESSDDVETCEENFNALVEIYTNSVDNYAPTIISDETKILFNEASELFNNSFVPVASETFRLAKLGDMNGAHNAGVASTEDINKMFDNYDQCLSSRIENAKATSDSNSELFSAMSIVLIAVIIVGIAISIILGIYISRIISRPINKMVEAADEISLGNTEINIEVESEDETGMLAGSFNRMIGGIKEQVSVVAAVADGDLTVSIVPRSEKDTMGIALEKTINQLNDIFNDINHASVQVSIGSEQVSNGAQALSQGATEQASSIEELSASITEISAQVNENAENVRLATDYVEQANAGVGKSNDQMKDMLVAMTDINNSSNEISKIIKVIDDIAFQTNILALNAAVEAARAGSAGKGFAVVADEVRNLASKSADAAKQTTSLIESSIKTVGAGAKIAEETAASLTEVAINTKLVNDSMEKISSASANQAAAITQVNTGIEQISSVIQTNSATAEESAASSEELSSQANLLKQQIAVFKIKKDKEIKKLINLEDINSYKDQNDLNFDTTSDGNKY